MSGWSLEFSKDANKDFVNLDSVARRRIILKLEWFIANFDTIFPIPLTGDYSDFYKLRVGDWRIFYTIKWNDKIIGVEYIDHRSAAYKKKSR